MMGVVGEREARGEKSGKQEANGVVHAAAAAAFKWRVP